MRVATAAGAQVLDVCSTGEEHLVVSYSRRTFLQTGDGHFSPIGAYHRERDLVLILDVVRGRPARVRARARAHAQALVQPWVCIAAGTQRVRAIRWLWLWL